MHVPCLGLGHYQPTFRHPNPPSLPSPSQPLPPPRLNVCFSFLRRRASFLPVLFFLRRYFLRFCQAVVRVMSPVVVNLVPFLSPPKRLHLFSCVARTPFHKYTEQTLHLVRSACFVMMFSFDVVGSCNVNSPPERRSVGILSRPPRAYRFRYIYFCVCASSSPRFIYSR